MMNGFLFTLKMQKKLYKLLRLLPFFLVASSLFNACRPPHQKHKDPTTLKIHLSNDPITLNPVLVSDAYSDKIASYIFESLIKRDNATQKFIPNLAEKWEISDNHLVYTFTLRKDVYFHDGHKMNAEDVLFTYEKIISNDNPNIGLKIYYKDVKKAEIISDYQIRFIMKRPYFKSLEFIGGMSVIPKHIFSKVKDFNNNEYNYRNPIGTGPYRFLLWKTRDKVILKRNEQYWGKKPQIKALEFKIMEDSSTALAALKKKDLDLMNLTPFQWERQTSTEEFRTEFNKIKYLSTSYRYIGYNCRKAPFNNADVRISMTHLINRKEIVHKLLKKLAIITTGPFWYESAQYNKKLKPRPFDPDKAAAHLKKAGYRKIDGYFQKNGKILTFELMIPSGIRFYEQFASIVREDMKTSGVKMEIRQIQFQALIEKINERNFDAYVLGWSMGTDTDPYQLWHSSQIQNGDNYPGFATPETDAIIEKARMEFDEKKRNALYHRFHEILYENQPYTFLTDGYILAVVHKRFENVNVYKTGMDLKEWSVQLNHFSK